jgi:hypothetical protein
MNIIFYLFVINIFLMKFIESCVKAESSHKQNNYRVSGVS